MEDYKEKYEMALEGIQEILSSGQDSIKMPQLQLRLQGIFPELKESEDEKIREMLIDSFTRADMGGEIYGKGVTYKQVIAWLEKQGEQKPIMNVPTREVILSIWDLGNEWKELTNGSISTEYGTQLDYIQKHWYESEYYLREKQGEQKPILDFKASNFYVSKVDGKIHDITYNPADKVEPKFKVKYAGSEYNVLEVKDIAGVTFYGIEDEPNHIDYVKAENCEIISGYAIKENGSPYPTKSAVFSEQKQEWSEEDKEMLDRIDDSLEAYATKVRSEKDYELEEILKEEQSWLYSLKDRILPQPKQEWSEEDNNFMYDTLSNLTELKDRYGDGYGKVGKCIEWLKSLKDRIGG